LPPFKVINLGSGIRRYSNETILHRKAAAHDWSPEFDLYNVEDSSLRLRLMQEISTYSSSNDLANFYSDHVALYHSQLNVVAFGSVIIKITESIKNNVQAKLLTKTRSDQFSRIEGIVNFRDWWVAASPEQKLYIFANARIKTIISEMVSNGGPRDQIHELLYQVSKLPYFLE
jgi:hypothetical protein